VVEVRDPFPILGTGYKAVLHSLPRLSGEIRDAGSLFELIWKLRCLVSFIAEGNWFIKRLFSDFLNR